MKNNQNGFSLIELLLVVVMIGIIAAIAVPSLTKAVAAAENGSVVATLKTIQLDQTTLFSQNNRYGSLDEVNQLHNGSLGQVNNNQLSRGKFIYVMVPANPTPEELRQGYTINATRSIVGPNELPYTVEINERGYITQIFP
jgi:prepilin-type N-terminal cleavage/methylation domain-containing protein